MRYYRISISLVKKAIRYPARIEESVVPSTIACMIPASGKRYTEIWAIYTAMDTRQIKIITAWRYPGKSPERNPIPEEILEEARNILRN
ncbi:MAG: hypothetical protein Q8P37_00830 [Candidatus Spechtbacteria bacterium]|nr:hypothetical protein [Candidatus Spechtbacteria bacterium]